MLPEGALSHDQLSVLLQRLEIAELQTITLDSLAGMSYRVLWRYATSAYMALEVSAPALALLAASLLVEEIVEDFELSPRLAQSGSLLQAPAAAALGVSGVGQAVVIVDSGVDRTHPFLAGRVIDEWCMVTTAGGCPSGSHGTGAAAPVSSHGTHVAGIAAGSGSSFSGVAPDAGIIAIKVFSSNGTGTFADVKAALDRVLVLKDTMTIAAVNLSLGADGFQSSSSCDGVDVSIGLKVDIDALRAAGIATLVANGNEGSPSSIGYPACLSSAIKVGATTKNDTIAVYSDRAPALESSMVLAPGGNAASSGSGNICSSRPAGYSTSRGSCSGSGAGGSYGFEAGTSMATPQVTGAWALLKQAKPTATVDEVLAALRSSARLITDADTGTTYRRIQVRDAIGVLTGLSVSIAADKSSPQAAGTPIRFTATSTGGVGTVTHTWRVFDGASWATAQNWSTPAIFDWTPGTGSSYLVSVWARSSTITAGDAADGPAAMTTASFVITNPAPTASGLSPTSAPAGSGAFTLTVTGANFVTGSVVRWNGSTRTTTYVSGTQLRAAIAATDVATGATPAVTVFNAAPGGGASGILAFTVIPADVTSLSAAQIAYAKTFALQAWPNYKSWETLPQYLKDEALQLAATSGAAPAAPPTAPVSSAAQLQNAKTLALQVWSNYKSWETLPQYLKDEALQAAAASGAAPAPSAPVAPVSSAAQLENAKAFALQAWPNYKSWESLPQYLKDDALQAAAGAGAATGATPPASSNTPGASAAQLQYAKAFALQAWPNYKSWETLPQYLQNEALQIAAKVIS